MQVQSAINNQRYQWPHELIHRMPPRSDRTRLEDGPPILKMSEYKPPTPNHQNGSSERSKSNS